MFKTLYGEYPPDSSLNYVWSKVESKGSAFESPYTDRSKIVVLQSGQGAGERWKAEKVDLLADYQAQFGKAPPERFRLGIMTDSDNTEGKTHAFIKSITVFSK